jgi:Tfp pilus assembly protein PilX
LTTFQHSFGRRRGWSPDKRGFALVLVLAMLVLLSGLVLAFLMSVRTDLSSSASYEKTTSFRILADTALNLVIGQIQEATQRNNEAWVSQPGLIRTFNTSGGAAMAYKLYSNDQMRVVGKFDPATGEDLPPQR